MVPDQVPLHVVFVAEPNVAEVTFVWFVFEVNCVYVNLAVANSAATLELLVADRTDIQLI